MKISDKKLQEKIGFKPFKGQQEVISSKAKTKFLACGWRWGKTTVAAYLGLRTALIPGKKVWICAPSYDMTKMVYTKALEWALEMFDSKHIKAQASINVGPLIEFPNGSTIIGKSVANKIGLMGEEVDLIIGDEAAQYPKDIYHQLLPRVADRDGDMVFISTPEGENWFHDEWLRTGGFQYETINRPSFPKDKWEQAKEMLPEDEFNQYYRAMFIKGVGVVFGSGDVKAIINDNAFEEPKDGELYVIGADLAKHKDFTVLTVVKKSQNRVVHVERMKEQRYPFQKKKIIELAHRYNNARVIIDSTGVGEPVYDDLFDEGLIIDDFRFTSKSKEQLIDKLRIFTESKSLVIPNFQPLIDEMRSFKKKRSPLTFAIKYEAPSGMHDDCVDSLALAVWALDTTPARIKKTALQKEKEKAKREFRRQSLDFV